MNTLPILRTLPLLAASLALLGPVVARPAAAAAAAADDTPAPPPTTAPPAAAASAGAAPVIPAAPVTPAAKGDLPTPYAPVPLPPFPAYKGGVSSPDPAWLSTRIDVQVHDAKILDALKQILTSAGAGDREIVDKTGFGGFRALADRRVTLEMKGVLARDAIAAVARLVEANAYASTNGDPKKVKTVLELRPRSSDSNAGTAYAPMIVTPNQDYSALGKDIQEQVRTALAQAGIAARQASTARSYYRLHGNHVPLSPNRVSLDKKEIDVRDALKDVLKQAGVDYALDPDVPTDIKKSFTFVNVPLETALDSICDAAGIGWTATPEPASDDAKHSPAGETEKVVIRIGKQFAANNGGGGRLSPLNRNALIETDSADALPALGTQIASLAALGEDATDWCLTPTINAALSAIYSPAPDEAAEL